jgi:hypothetical protein
MQPELHATNIQKQPGGFGAKTYANDPFQRVLTVYFRGAAAATPINTPAREVATIPSNVLAKDVRRWLRQIADRFYAT